MVMAAETFSQKCMNAHGFRMREARTWTCLCVVLALASCVGLDKEITSAKPYADLIGAKYIVVADGLYAYGVYGSQTGNRITSVHLIPIGIGGPEIAFRRNVPKGTVFQLLSAWRGNPLMESSVYYRVAVENWDLPQDIPIELQLDRGNEGVGADLNPDLYRKLPRDN